MRLNPKFNSSKEFLDKLNIFVYATIGLPMGLFLYFYLNYESSLLTPFIENSKTISYLTIGISATLATLGIFLYKKQLSSAVKEDSLKEKMTSLFNSTVLKFLFFLLSGITITIAFIITGHPLYTALYVVNLIVCSINNPSPHRTARELKLNVEEGMAILNKEPLNF
ncbi:hypothetical protein [Aureibacter tunicatorum]|uniref:Uncharacterized protein with PQ loop repeat n=1 Tax=Aureibacter tunicatorum TaxID=866807 RepID=A0AAE4BV12_9BACT|nr:hypothetical protein [Aureibacter tunicatorum]MDR6241318.1 uncharacterized protein with PQ loop repeat [Aureibacter tunicatorum]BDD03577.1 hypothetical protein AUTU_10600 [Aureibacter tunicatorum]